MASYMGHEYTPAPKYKVGDRVKVIDGARGDTFPVGEFGTIQDVLGHGVTVSRDGHGDYGWFFSPHEVEPAPTQVVQGRYRVGDWVRVIDADGGGKVGDIGTVTSAEYAPEEKEFYYQISDLSRNATGLFGYRLAPAFRPGDRVKLNKHSGFRACGERGTVSAVIGDNVSVRMDDVSVHGTVVAFFHADNLDWEREEDVAPVTSAHDCAGRKDEQDNVETLTIKLGLDTTDFDNALAEFRAAYNQPCIVALTTNGKPRPSSYPHVHASVEAATKEAERLARNNPGQEFAVYQRVAGRQCEVSYEMKEVA